MPYGLSAGLGSVAAEAQFAARVGLAAIANEALLGAWSTTNAGARSALGLALFMIVTTTASSKIVLLVIIIFTNCARQLPHGSAASESKRYPWLPQIVILFGAAVSSFVPSLLNSQ